MSALSTLSDNELYILLAQDNEEAFTILYHRYWKRMLYKALQKLQCDTDAEEVVQDTFVDIWKSRKRIQIQNTFHTYLASIVKYKIIAKIAANNKTVYDNVEDIQQLHVADDSTQQWLSFYDMQLEIEAAIKALPDKCQLIFRMSRETGLSDKEIASHLQLSQKTVEAHISRALKALRTNLREFVTFLSLLITLITRV